MNSKQEALRPALPLAVPRPAPGYAFVAVLVLFIGIMVLSGWLRAFGPEFNDPDSMMRLVEVRDFLAGQGWYDLTQYRLAPPAGVFMHWSRYVDAPIAGLIVAFTPVVGRAGAEVLAANVWPLILFVPFALGLAAIVHRFAGWTAVFLTMLLLGLSPSVLNLFRPGDIDHHNLQAVLLIWLLAGLVRADVSRPAAAFAGFCAATSLAIGLETLPAVLLAVGGLVAAWIYDGERWRGGLIIYALTLAGATALHFVATVPVDRWFVAACDQISIVYLFLAVAGGVGVAAIATVFRGRDDGSPGLLVRGGALLTLGCFLVAVTALCFPACLAGPYGGVDPRLGPIWLDHVDEAQGLLSTLRFEPWRLPLFLAPLAATLACVLGFRLVVPADRPAFVMLLTIMIGSALLGCVQLRGLVGAQILASASLGITAANLFRATAGRDDLRAILTRWSWVLAAPVLWFALGDALAPADRSLTPGTGPVADCSATLVRDLEQLPPSVIAATSNFGSRLLLSTPHAVLAAPYHRDTTGILAVNAILTSADGVAELTASGAGYLAVCKSDPEFQMAAERAPNGLAARLIAGERPAALKVVNADADVLVLQPAADAMVTGSLPDRPSVFGLRPSLDP
jgi:hypothetical protein